jgi:hypothetical protein
VALSSWFNNCDIPAGEQNSQRGLSFGPSITVSRGPWRIYGTLYRGTFDVVPDQAVVLEGGEPVFADGSARSRGFTSDGDITRFDATIDVGYEFNRYATLSFGLSINRRSADVETLWFPVRNTAGGIVLPDERRFEYSYEDTQYWISQSLRGSVPINTDAARFSLFYNGGLVILGAETGHGRVETAPGVFMDTSPRVTYTPGGEIGSPGTAEDLGLRDFGANVGVTFATGIGFPITHNPALGAYVGYSLKFYSEDATELIDHSRYQGPFFGVSYRIR